MTLSITTVGLLCAIFALVQYISRSKRKSLKFLRGPPSPSWLLGNEYDLSHQFEVGKLEDPWVEEYGTIFKFAGCFGEEFLHISDPKALQHILHASSYHYPKTDDVRKATRRIFGRAIVWAEGETHQRHRKALNPAFSASQLKTFLSLFQRSIERFSDKWQAEFFSSFPSTSGTPSEWKQINIYRWLPRITLDVIGESAFDYRFGALDATSDTTINDDKKGDLGSTIRHLFDDSTAISKWSMFLRAVRRGLWWDPTFQNPFNPDSPLILTREDRRFNSWLEASKVAARDILNKKSQESGQEEDKDILSILVRSNHLTDPHKRLDDEEVLSQMGTIILAGHETTASTTTWMLYELARHPEDQRRVREEIQEVWKRKREAGEDVDEGLNSNDYDSMEFFNAVLKETLRLYPIVIALFRCSDRDDVIPLDEPIISASGEKLKEIPVGKGQRVHINITGYNKLKSVWGPDAHTWNPERFLDMKKGTTLGVYANLLTFSAGVRSCIGWRFALLEMQVILAGLLERYEFMIQDPEMEIYRAQAGFMVPIVRGKETDGPQMPLGVRRLKESSMEGQTDV
ncbi:cytochrome P450 [Dendrothele bispora CBS 962.96]|uniref:Cytochrome P450 n=1 Tax=Dendrothele bispora (strain CBS 962.96) TaxID=1314807 RepID=A0A4V4HFX2_DENBC|nr:cytochrome P450 [Dendrothele bispora CBS 962.96]